MTTTTTCGRQIQHQALWVCVCAIKVRYLLTARLQSIPNNLQNTIKNIRIRTIVAKNKLYKFQDTIKFLLNIHIRGIVAKNKLFGVQNAIFIHDCDFQHLEQTTFLE